jgi:hypothetical protein
MSKVKRVLLSALLLLPGLALAQNCPKGWERHPEKHPECYGPLPVTVKSFKAVQNGPIVSLEWTVGVEKNHSHYEIERSVNGLEWVNLGQTTKHNFEDYKPLSDAYYRLVSIDLDGTKNYYNIIYIKTEIKSFEVTDIYGKSLGVFNSYQDLPKNRALVINKKKVYLY